MSYTRKTLEDIKWEPVIWGRILIASNINAYSPVWNLHCHKRQNTTVLEELMERFDVLIHNKPGHAIFPSSQNISMIDLAFFTANLVF